MKPASFSVCFALLVVLCACQRNMSHPGGTGSPTGPTGGSSDSLATVYVVGYDQTSNAIWKNGAKTPLPDTNLSYISGITLSGSDVYLSAGLNRIDSLGHTIANIPEYYKNGVRTVLQDTGIYATTYGISVAGTDVFVAGVIGYHDTSLGVPYTTYTQPINYSKFGSLAGYWKNGKLNLCPGSLFTSQYKGFGEVVAEDQINGIFANASDVYMVGGSRQWQTGVTNSLHFTLEWRDGTPSDLVNNLTGTVPDSTTGALSPQATGVFGSGSDIYVSGYQYLNKSTLQAQAVYWKNGIPTYLTDNTGNARAYAVTVSGSDVYVAGYMVQPSGRLFATYWKNGAAVVVDSSSSGWPKYIGVVGKDVYMAGVYNTGGYYAPVYWKNGQRIALGSQGNVTGMAVQAQ
jgi:hypothetical protein